MKEIGGNIYFKYNEAAKNCLVELTCKINSSDNFKLNFCAVL